MDNYDNYDNDISLSLSDDDNDNNSSRLLKVQLYDTKGSYTILEAYPGTKASDILDAIINKIDLTPEESTYYTLILVHSRFYQSSISSTTTPSSSSSISKYHCLKTLRSNDDVWETLNHVISKQSLRYDKLEGYEATKVYNRWFFKDIRSTPVDMGDNVSGNSSSDDEESISLSEMSYLRQGERRGYLLRRSNRDPNLWRKRYCVLTDKLWCMDVKRLYPRSRCIKITSTSLITDRTPSLEYPNCLVLHDTGNTNFFRASSSLEHQQWQDDIHQRCILAKENDVFTMAEMIMSDEEGTRGQRYTKGISQLLNSEEMISMLMDYKVMDYPIAPPPPPSSSSYSNKITNNGGDSYNNYSILSKECLKRRVHRHRRNMIHSLHTHNDNNVNEDSDNNNTLIFNSLSCIIAIQKYKELHRHDLFISPREQWMTALKIYKIFLLPYLLKRGYIKQDNIIENVTFDDNDSNDNNDKDNIDNHYSGWRLSFKTITSVHNIIFSNIKRKVIDVNNNTKTNDTSNTEAVTSDSNNGFWSWTKAFSTTSDSPLEIYESKKVDSNDHCDISLQYDIIDNIVPSSTLFDEIVKEVETSFTYINNDKSVFNMHRLDSLDDYEPFNQSGIQSEGIHSTSEESN